MFKGFNSSEKLKFETFAEIFIKLRTNRSDALKIEFEEKTRARLSFALELKKKFSTSKFFFTIVNSLITFNLFKFSKLNKFL